MSDLAATNCGCDGGFRNNNGCDCILWILILSCICGNGFGFGGCDKGCGWGGNNCWLLILILLFCGNGFGFGGCDNGCGCGNDRCGNNCGC